MYVVFLNYVLAWGLYRRCTFLEVDATKTRQILIWFVNIRQRWTIKFTICQIELSLAQQHYTLNYIV